MPIGTIIEYYYSYLRDKKKHSLPKTGTHSSWISLFQRTILAGISFAPCFSRTVRSVRPEKDAVRCPITDSPYAETKEQTRRVLFDTDDLAWPAFEICPLDEGPTARVNAVENLWALARCRLVTWQRQEHLAGELDCLRAVVCPSRI